MDEEHARNYLAAQTRRVDDEIASGRSARDLFELAVHELSGRPDGRPNFYMANVYSAAFKVVLSLAETPHLERVK